MSEMGSKIKAKNETPGISELKRPYFIIFTIFKCSKAGTTQLLYAFSEY
jgi:hypothetical protein